MLASLAMIVGMTSCSKNDDSNTDNNASIVGTWGCVHNTYTGTPTEQYQNNYEGFHREDNFAGSVISFNNDGTYSSSFGNQDNPFRESGTWMKDESTLITKRGNHTYNWEIRQLTAERLIIYSEYNDGPPHNKTLLIELIRQ